MKTSERLQKVLIAGNYPKNGLSFGFSMCNLEIVLKNGDISFVYNQA